MFQRSRDDKNGRSDRKCFRCGDPNPLIRECPKPLKDKNQIEFVRGSWSDSGEEDDEKSKDETCLVAQASNENEKPSGGGPPNTVGGPHKAQTAPKAIKGPPVCSPESEKSVSFQKSILGPRPKHIMVNNVKIPVASDNKICLGVNLEPDEWIKDSGCSKHMKGNRKLFLTYKAYNRGNVIFCSNLCGNIIGKGQICDNKYRVTFSKHDIEITKDGKVIGRESLNVTFDETPPPSKISPLVDDDLDEEEAIKVTKKKNLENDIENETLKIDKVVNIKESKNP
ncbi:retrovirus-related pol polyprotein from transposon TNT 1-94 [Tanacetum coccineum]